ncbi:hypothetical protein HMPREF1987_01741 [Peptostreptococcaceae bacterium oral taxon 113 str. W5053]|nr:hypothetical protein HMPREF1987_01741 [Peptostreptococcaceae bacterium oral taxon 113 str. W5053]
MDAFDLRCNIKKNSNFMNLKTDTKVSVFFLFFCFSKSNLYRLG